MSVAKLVKLAPDMKDWLDDEASKTNRSSSDLIREALLDYREALELKRIKKELALRALDSEIAS